jgi:hypothetical protein
VFTTVVFVTAINSLLTALIAPSTLTRCRPDAARTYSLTNDHRQPKERPVNHVRHVHEEHVPLALLGLFEPWLQLALEGFGRPLDVFVESFF